MCLHEQSSRIALGTICKEVPVRKSSFSSSVPLKILALTESWLAGLGCLGGCIFREVGPGLGEGRGVIYRSILISQIFKKKL